MEKSCDLETTKMLYSLECVCVRYLWLCVTYFLSVEDDKWLDKSQRASFSFKTFISSDMLRVFVFTSERLIYYDNLRFKVTWAICSDVPTLLFVTRCSYNCGLLFFLWVICFIKELHMLESYKKYICLITYMRTFCLVLRY